MEFLKNPLVLALTITCLTCAYISFDNKEKIKEIQKEKPKEEPKKNDEQKMVVY